MQDLKMGDQKDETLENAGPENAGPNVSTWKCRTSKVNDVISRQLRNHTLSTESTEIAVAHKQLLYRKTVTNRPDARVSWIVA